MPQFKEYAHYYDLIYAKKPYEREARFVLSWLPRKPKRILDLGCGTGKHALTWAKQGIEVFAVDRSSDMLLFAPKHAKIHYMKREIYPFLFGEEIKHIKPDCITAMFNVVGYVDLLSIMQTLPLKKGGYFVFDAWDSQRVDQYPPSFRHENFDTFSRVVIPTCYTKESLRTNIWLNILLVNNSDNSIISQEEHRVQAYDMLGVYKYAKKCGLEIVAKKPYAREGDWTCWYKLRKK